ncbi:MAG: mechanosensitive ion channel family protein [Ktedonobacteraceae bacterium]
MPVVTNWGEAVLTSLGNALNLVLTFIPKLIGFLIILLIGWLIATAISKAVVFLLRKVGFDNMANRIGLTRMEQRVGMRLDPAGVLGKIVYWFVLLIFLIPAVDSLGLTSVSNILNSIIAYIPNVFVAIIVLFLGTLLATFVADIVRGFTSGANVGSPSVFAGIARWAIIGFAALIALEQLQIAPALMNILFTAIIGAVAIAFGLAFGLGGQETARRLLARSENTVTDAASKIQAQQAQQNMYQANQVQMQPQTSGQPQQMNPAYQQPAYTQPTMPQQGYQQPYDDRTMPNQQPYNGPTR